MQKAKFSRDGPSINLDHYLVSRDSIMRFFLLRTRRYGHHKDACITDDGNPNYAIENKIANDGSAHDYRKQGRDPKIVKGAMICLELGGL